MKIKNAQHQNPLDPELASIIDKIKHGQTWQSNGEQKSMMKMTMSDKFLMFGLLGTLPSTDMAQVNSTIKELKKKNGWPSSEEERHMIHRRLSTLKMTTDLKQHNRQTVIRKEPSVKDSPLLI